MNTVKPNPWKGVVPYSDNAEDLAIHPFRGRDKEISELLKVIDRYNISTLYGRSGIGKTSLLNAGAFPRLREKGFYPVRIRLTDHEENFALAITSRLKDIAVLQDETAWPLSIPRAEAENGYLWAYFAYHRFFVGEDEVIPVIVLDQFEEVLRKAKKKSSLLIKQLYDTLQDGLLANGTPYTIGFRFVISLREDDLYLLEELLDQNYIDTLKQGRYRLRPAGEEGIEEIVNIRPGVIADDKELPDIIHLLTEKTQQDEQVSTLLLSLVCSQLYEATNGAPITLQNVTDMLKNSKTDILETFYDKATEQLDVKAKDYLIAHCVDEDGRRKPVLKTELEQHIGKNHADNLCDETKPHHIFTAVSGELLQRKNYVELLHDQLAIILLAKRAKQQAEKRLRRIRKWAIVLGIIATLIGLISLTVPRIMTATTPLDTQLAEIGDTLVDQGRHYRSVTNFVDLSKYKKIKETALVGLCGANRMRIRSSQLGDIQYCTFPEIDTLEVVMDSMVHDTEEIVFWSEPVDYNQLTVIGSVSFPNLEMLKIEGSAKDYEYTSDHSCNHLPKLKAIEVQDTSVLHLHRGTLYACSDSLSRAIITSTEGEICYEETYFSNLGFEDPKNATKIIDFDIAKPHKKKIANDDRYYRIICSNPEKSSINATDIPREILPNVIEAYLPNITAIGDSVFCYSHIRKLYAPRVTTLGEHAFSSCIYIDSICMENVKSLGDRGFFGCISLCYANIGKPDTIPEGTFCACHSLKEITGTTSVKHIKKFAFLDCTALSSINIPNVEYIDSCSFEECINLTSISGLHVKYIGAEAFMKCHMLQNAIFPQLEEIADDAFSHCSRLQHIDFSQLKRIGSYIFDDCTLLQNIWLPKVEHVKKFGNCPSLQTLYLDNAKTFRGVFPDNLKILYAPQLDSLWYSASFDSPTTKLKIWLPNLRYLEMPIFDSKVNFEIHIPDHCSYLPIEYILDTTDDITDTTKSEVWGKRMSIHKYDVDSIYTPVYITNSLSKLPSYIKREPSNNLQKRCATSANKHTLYPKPKEEQGYSIIGNTIIINDTIIHHLHIASGIEEIVGLHGNQHIYKISVSPINTHFMMIGNALYHISATSSHFYRFPSYRTHEYGKPVIYEMEDFDIYDIEHFYPYGVYIKKLEDSTMYSYRRVIDSEIFYPKRWHPNAKWYLFVDNCTIIIYKNHYQAIPNILKENGIHYAKMLVPYGEANVYRTQLRGEDEITIEEMSWLKTLYYRIAYSSFITDIRIYSRTYRLTLIWLFAVTAFVVWKRLIRKRKLRWKDGLWIIGLTIVMILLLPIINYIAISADKNDFLVVGSYIAVMLGALVVAWRHQKTKFSLQDFIIGVILASTNMIIWVFAVPHHGHFSMWPIWFSVPLWVAYLVFITKRRRKKLQHSSEDAKELTELQNESSE
jgi:hypothetical protein